MPKFKGAPKHSLVERAHPAAGDLNRAHSVDLTGGHLRAPSGDDGNRVAIGVVVIEASQNEGPWDRLNDGRGQSASGVYHDRGAYRITGPVGQHAVDLGSGRVDRGNSAA